MRHHKTEAHGETPTGTPATRRRWRRLAPFIRRDLHASVKLAAASAFMVLALCVSMSASLASSSTPTAAGIRYDLGIESRPTAHARHAMYFSEEDRLFAQKSYDQAAKARVAILDELRLRLAYATSLATSDTAPSGDHEHKQWLQSLLVVSSLSEQLSRFHVGQILAPLALNQGTPSELRAADETIEALLARERPRAALPPGGLDRDAFSAKIRAIHGDCDVQESQCTTFLSWIDAGGAAPISPLLAKMSHEDFAGINDALNRTGVWLDDCHPRGDHEPEGARSHNHAWSTPPPLALASLPLPHVPWFYENPAPLRAFLFMFGGLCWLVSWFLLTVVSPAAATYRAATEQEMGTFPNLQMTGLSARELAAAIAVASNLFPLAGGLLGLCICALTWSSIGLGTAVAATIPGLGAGLLVGLSIALVVGQSHGRRKNPTLLAVAVAAVCLGGGVCGLIGMGTSTVSWSIFGPGALGLAGLLQSGLPSQLWNGFGEPVSAWRALSITIFTISVAGGTLWITQRIWARKLERTFAVTLTRNEALIVVAFATTGGLFWFDEQATRWNWDASDLSMMAFLVNLALASIIASVALASTRRPALAGVRPSRHAVRRSFLWANAVIAVVVGISLGGLLHASNSSLTASPMLGPIAVQATLTVQMAMVVILLRARTPQSVLRTMIASTFLVGGNLVITVITVAIGTERFSHASSSLLPFIAQIDAMVTEGIAPVWVGLVILLWLASAAALLLLLSGRGPMGTSYDDEILDDDDDDDDDDSWDEPGPPMVH